MYRKEKSLIKCWPLENREILIDNFLRYQNILCVFKFLFVEKFLGVKEKNQVRVK